MKKVLIAAVAALGLTACSSDSDRDASVVVGRPYTAGNNSRIISLNAVELNDSSTVLHLRCDYVPGKKMTIVSSAQLDVNGKRYKLIGAKGLIPDSMIAMPESGRLDFSLIFNPIPSTTQTVTFMEAETPYEWHIWGIDLTGKRKFAENPVGVPEELVKAPSATDSMPAYVMDADSARVNVMVLEYETTMGPTVAIATPGVDKAYAHIVQLDAMGCGSLTIPVHGTTKYEFRATYEQLLGTTWIAPGETVNVYLRPVDTYAKNESIKRRNIFTDGVYGPLTAAMELYGDLADTPDLDQESVPDNGEEASRRIADWYQAGVAALRAANIPAMLRQYKTAELQNRVMELAGNPVRDYTPAQLQRMLEPIDMESADLLMVNGGQFPEVGRHTRLGREFTLYREAAERASRRQLTDADRKMLRGFSSPFFLKSAEMLNKEARKELAQSASDMIAPVPYYVPAEQLFDTIVGRYPGKIVIVDLWNTWCGPCRTALSKIEPLKSGELDSDDIVWVYIASETSPMPKYLELIPEIKGVHYRLARNQIRPIYERFGVDGIPFYIMVDRDGKVTARPDFRDHDLMVSTIKEAL